MKLLALLTMLSGFLLAVLTLRIANGEFDDLGLIALATAVPNALSALIAWLLIRQKKEETTGEVVLMGIGFVAGIVCGAYTYYT